jgi:lysine 6-dehydrogenase
VFDLLDYYDEKNGISAMERTTGFSLAITGLIQARRQVRQAGVLTPDVAMPADRYIEELRRRNIDIQHRVEPIAPDAAASPAVAR